MLNLPIYLLGSSYYIHTRINGQQVKKSLRTAYKREAIIRAISILNGLRMSTPPTKYELDLSRGVLKSDGLEDHTRLLQAMEAMKAIHAGQAPAVASNTVTAPLNDDPTALKLNELLEKFFLLRKVTQATAISYKNATEEFKTFLKNPPITRISVSDITRWQEHLAEKQKNVPRTIDSKVGVIKAIFNFAKKQGYTRGENPAENRSLLTKKQKLKDGFAIFEKTEIELLLNSKFYKEQKVKDEDYAYAVLFALFTGCRIGEITNLKIDQFKLSNKGTPYITIRDSKTLAGIREIPLHPYIWAVIQLFISTKTDKVFKYVEKDGKGSGNAVGKKFARNVESAGITRDKLVFHSIRKFVNNELMRNKVSLEHRCQFIGHELDNVNVSVYTNSINIDELAASVFPTFDSFVKIVDPLFKVEILENVDLADLLQDVEF